MNGWISRYYPGTKTAITEYNFGALDSMNGALAQADALGIFGAQGLGMADLWSPPTAKQPGAFAFAMYRNVDGRHHGFGTTSVKAHSARQGKLAIYAATRSSGGALTVMVINKTGGALTSAVSIRHFAAAKRASVYTYGRSDLSAVVHDRDVSVSGGRLARTFAADSITLLVIPRAAR
jgi:hypothetical protein